MDSLKEVFAFIQLLISDIVGYITGGEGFYALIGIGIFVAGAVIGLVYRLIRG